MNELHSLLKRQLRRFTSETEPSIEETDFLRAINDAYWQFDADRRMLEHSLELTSQELLERNAELSRVNTDLEMRVAARTAELSNSEARFRGLFEHAPVSIWEEDFSAARQYIDDLRAAGIVDFPAYFEAHPEAVAECAKQVKIVDVNRATLEMYQAESKAQLLADLSKVLGPESLVPFMGQLLALARGETSFESETINYTLRGDRRVIFLRLTVAPGCEDTWDRVFVGISDITKRREAENALGAERDLLQSLMDNIPDTIYFKDTASRFTRINRAQAKVLGVAVPEEAVGKTDLDFQETDLARSFYEEEQRIIETGEPLINRIEFNPTPDGKRRWFSATKVPIKNPEGSVIGIAGISRDITERKQVDEKLAASEAELRTLFGAMQDVVIVFDREGRYVQVAPTSTDQLYQSPQEMLGKTVFDVLPQALAQTIHDAIQEALRTRELIHVEYALPLRGGEEEVWKDAAVSPLTQDTVFWIARDITERKRAEEALHESQERFRSLSEAAFEGLMIHDRGIILNANQAFADLFGFHNPDELIGRNGFEILPLTAESREKIKSNIERSLPGASEIEVVRGDGSTFPAETQGRDIIYKGRKVRVVAMRDITARKQNEETIRHQNEMLASLHQITLALLRYREIDQLLNALVELSAKFLDAPYVEIMLADGNALVVKAATQNQPRLRGERVGRGDALLSWQAFDTHEPAVLSDYASWSHRRAIYDEFLLHAVADFPILNDDQCLGVLALGRDKPDYEFTLDQIQFGRLFANLTALVLDNAQLREALREQSIRDPLTGLYNRRYMEEALQQHLSRVTRHLHPLGTIMVDIDHFKRINDTYGHATGDALLRELGKLLKNHVRNEDIACRYGGEEFMLIMPDASLEIAHQRAEFLRQEAKKLRVQDAGQSFEGITLSLGVAIYPQHGRTKESVLRAADAALYRAKQEGRDRVVVAEGAQ